MPTMFSPDDVSACFGVWCENAPEYRVITLTADGVVEGQQMGGTDVTLLCKEWLVEVHRVDKLEHPVVWVDEKGNDKECGPPEIAVMILPIKLTKSQVAALRKEICEEVPVEKHVKAARRISAKF